MDMETFMVCSCGVCCSYKIHFICHSVIFSGRIYFCSDVTFDCF